MRGGAFTKDYCVTCRFRTVVRFRALMMIIDKRDINVLSPSKCTQMGYELGFLNSNAGRFHFEPASPLPFVGRNHTGGIILMKST